MDTSKKHVGQDASEQMSLEATTTKQRIIESAATLFATKGFTETTIRELASAVGLQGSSIYNHFESKTAILEYMLDDYVKNNSGAFFDESARVILAKKPSVEGILQCHSLVFTGAKAAYYFKVLSMILQEQHRNPVVNEYVRGNIEQNEKNTLVVIEILKEYNVLKKDTNPDYWMKLVSSVYYTFMNRAVLGNGDSSPDYKGMGMVELLKSIFENMMRDCSIAKSN
jgi:AcrR family transcriptional regulator